MQSIFLEFRDTKGNFIPNEPLTSLVIDPRVSDYDRLLPIYEHIEHIRTLHTRFKDAIFVGYTVLSKPGKLHVSLVDLEPPIWFSKFNVPQKGK